MKTKKSHSVNSMEWGIRNYMTKHNIYPNNPDIHMVIINSFINTRFSNLEDIEWRDRIKYIQSHFGLFAQYAQNNWKHKQTENNEKS